MHNIFTKEFMEENGCIFTTNPINRGSTFSTGSGTNAIYIEKLSSKLSNNVVAM